MIKKMASKSTLELSISSLLSAMFFDRALWIIYIIERGLSTVEIGIIESFLHFSILIFEIPTGIIADIFGRKFSLIISRLIIAVYAIGMIFVNSFTLFSLLFILLGLSEALASGADTALLYDNATSQEQRQFTKTNGLYNIFISAGTIIGMFIGGVLKNISWELIYISLAAIQIISIIPLLKIKEIYHETSKNRKYKFNLKIAITDICIFTKNVFADQTFLIFILATIIFTAPINALYLFSPIWLKQLGFSESIISYVFAFDALISMIIFMNAHKIEKTFGLNKLIIFPAFIATPCLLLLPYANTICVIILFIAINSMSSLIYLLSSKVVNKQINSKQRATILSSISFMQSIVIMILFPLIGFLAKKINIGYIFQYLSIFSGLSGIFFIYFNQRSRKRNAKT